ncbi:hypothetical protein SAMN05421827_11917 [Pedobacter terrae]|uniref:Uncharacterized protein n=1 Tax=Pedobacter terrae TaxID=405671 RepID=A0A1G8AHZ1_9SPHI|nr:hypothetical protein [Pedobacter terrae]SDH20578.1 hypothetical protein SAMN05421827_11917 [Pedobacter terrae]
MTPICSPLNVMVYPMLISGSFIVVTLIIFFCLAAWTSLLREEITNNEEFQNNHKQLEIKLGKTLSQEYPFSLSKVQLGVWTMVISSSYIYLSLFKGDCAETDINKTALVLLGIFSGTAVTSKIIDKRELKDQRPRHQNTPSRGFLTDILSDDAGISIHRFQHVVWTLVGVAIYLYKIGEIKTGCILPELSDTLLTLMGISSATFVAIRSKENDPEAARKSSAPDVRPVAESIITPPYQVPTTKQALPTNTNIGNNSFYG